MGRLASAALLLAALAPGVRPANPLKTARLTPITVAMGFTANVQFAPFYVALIKGYYRREGLQVTLRYGIEPDLLRLASQGRVDFVDSGGDEVLTAGAQGLHVRYIMTQYSRFPAALFALSSTGIRRLRDLRGRSIGIPGKFGASYVGLLALLNQGRISESNVAIKSIGFNQTTSVAHRQVDAAVGYAMNEPVFLREQGYRITEFDIYRWANLAGAGIATGDAMIARRPALVRAFVRATLRGLRDTLDNPSQAFLLSTRAVPAIGSKPSLPRAVLRRALAFWRPDTSHPLGWMNPRIWNETAAALYRYKQIPHRIVARNFYTNRFLP